MGLEHTYDYSFFSSCVEHRESEVHRLHEMTSQAQPVSLRTFRRHCAGVDEWAKQAGYATRRKDGLILSDDWAVEYYRSTYNGRRCYYIRWSAIEFIWVSTRPTHYIVQVASAAMPAKCRGHYARIAVLKVDAHLSEVSMISTHARGCHSIVRTWERLNVGKTERCAFQRAFAEAQDLADALNAARLLKE